MSAADFDVVPVGTVAALQAELAKVKAELSRTIAQLCTEQTASAKLYEENCRLREQYYAAYKEAHDLRQGKGAA